MNQSKKEMKNLLKDEYKLENINQQIEENLKEIQKDDCDEIISLKFQKKDINQHCILRADSQDDIIITLDGWNQGNNNLIIWQGDTYSEKQRISFIKSNKMSDLCFINKNKSIFCVGGEDKQLRIYQNKQNNDNNYNYEEIYNLKLKNKINCIKSLNRENLIVGSKNGPINIINFINFDLFLKTNYQNEQEQTQNVDVNSPKVDLKIDQKVINLHERKVNEIFIYQERYLFSLGEDKQFILYDTFENKKLDSFQQQSCIRCGYLNLTSNTFYTGNTGGEIIVYQYENSKDELKCKELKKININSYIYQIIAFEDTSYILFSTNKKLWYLFNTIDNQTLQKSSAYSDYISVLHKLANEMIFLGEGKNLFEIFKFNKIK